MISICLIWFGYELQSRCKVTNNLSNLSPPCSSVQSALVQRGPSCSEVMAAPSAGLIAGSRSALKIQVHERQRKNPIIDRNMIRNVEWEFSDEITPDFMLGPTTCALFLSLRFHLLKPSYIKQRIQELRGDFRSRRSLSHIAESINSSTLTQFIPWPCLLNEQVEGAALLGGH